MSTAAVLLGTGALSSDRVLAEPKFYDNPFRLGVASGDPLPDGVVLWTRLAPDPLAEDGHGGMPLQPFRVRYEVSEDENFRRIVRRGTVEAVPELAHSVHAEVSGLLPGREYYYRFAAGNELSPVGRTKTAPAAGSSPASMAFAFASCQAWAEGHYTAYKHMAEEDLDVVFHLGDYIYEHPIRATGGVRNVPVPSHFNRETVTLAEYRNRHALYRSDENLQAAHARFPWVVSADDHEVENNWADEKPEATTLTPTREQFMQRRVVAFRAFYEGMPLRATSIPRGPDIQLYRRFGYGNLAEFNMLDTRQYRDDQAAGDGNHPANRESLDPSRTITGAEQERWLFDNLQGSRATWNVLAQQVFMAQWDIDTGDGQVFTMDSWDGYVGSRNRLFDFIRDAKIANPVVLTGDVHDNWANNLKVDFDDPNSQTLGVEFVGTSISSFDDGADTKAVQVARVEENPHIKFYNGQRGYVRCRLTPESYQADYRVIPYVTRPGAPISTRASFVTQSGNPGLQQV